MNPDFSLGKHTLVAIFLITLLFGLYYLFDYEFNRSTTVVFCDVGQGDGAYIRINNRLDILIDAGPEHAILQCLGRHMPFYDRTIEVGFVSHPQLDHYGGFIDVMKQYKLRALAFNTPKQNTKPIEEFLALTREKHVSIVPFLQGQKILLQGALFESKWPSQQAIDVSPKSIDPNDLSQIIRFSQRSMSILFTGDITPGSDTSLLQQPNFNVKILKVPHHGSINGLTMALTPLANPRAAVISVGAKNRYGHPSRTVVDYLQKKGIKVLRTDEKGDVVFRF
jgi:competence protein ComEC